MAADPMLPGVGWAWLTEALDGARRGVHRGQRHGHPGVVGELRRHRRASPRRRRSRSGRPGPRSTTRFERRTCWPGATCSARPPGCRRSRPGVVTLPPARARCAGTPPQARLQVPAPHAADEVSRTASHTALDRSPGDRTGRAPRRYAAAAATGRALHRPGGRGEPVRARDARRGPCAARGRRGRRGRQRWPRPAPGPTAARARDLVGRRRRAARRLRHRPAARAAQRSAGPAASSLSSADDPYTVRAALAAGVRAFLVTAPRPRPPAAHGAPPRAAAAPAASRLSGAEALSGREVEVLQLVAGRPLEQGHRRGPGPVRADREEPPGPHRPQARHRRPRRDGRRRHARRRRRLTSARATRASGAARARMRASRATHAAR